MDPTRQINQLLGSYPFLVPIIFLWSSVWKGFALWHSARNKQTYWFIALLIVNLLGVPEIAYLLFFQKEGRWIEKIRQSLLR
ncbi:MAG: DUF5652 family protein [Microgenomates group bacterium]